MKRLVKKSEKAYIELNELDEADVKFDRCPICKTDKNLTRENGIKICSMCGTKYKLFEGKGHVIIN